MPIPIICPSSECKTKLRAPDQAAGKKLKCPKCGAPITVPENGAVRKAQEVEQAKVVQQHDPFAGIGENQQEEEGVSSRTRRKQGSPVMLLVALGAVLVIVPAVAGVIWWSLRNSEKEPQQLVEGPADTKTSDPVPKSVPKANPPAETRPIEKKLPPGISEDEDEAKAKLKIALDSLVFGDSFEKFKKDHPNINFFELDRLYVLLRYEITAARKTKDNCYEFAVILVFKSEAGTEIRKNKRYEVAKYTGGWNISNLTGVAERPSNDDPPPVQEAKGGSGAPVPKEPEPPAPDPAKQQRTKLLAEIESKRKEQLAAAEAEQKQNEAAIEKLRQKEVILRANPRFGDLFDKQAAAQFNAFQQESRALAAKLQKSKEEWDRKWIDLEQERRRSLVKFPEPGDPRLSEHKNLLYTAEELEQVKTYEREHATPRAAANAYIKALEDKGNLTRDKNILTRDTGYAGLYKNTKAEDSYVVCYNTPPVGGFPQPVHVYVLKDKEGYWQVVPLSTDGIHVMRGPPPTGYTRTKELEPMIKP